MAADHNDKWPVAKFHFRVELGSLGQISFKEVSGLDQETQVLEYRHGDSPVFSNIKSAGLMKFSNITMKKGVFHGDSDLLDFFHHIYDKKFYFEKGERIDIGISLLDEETNVIMHWNVHHAFPVKFSGTDLKSDGNEVALESIEFAHEGITTSLSG